jgi:DNA-binding SARP family transcriptional activator
MCEGFRESFPFDHGRSDASQGCQCGVTDEWYLLGTCRLLVVVRAGESSSRSTQYFRLRLLGSFQLTYGLSSVELPVGAQRVVAVAALRGRMSRSRIAGSLWPETTEHRALASLRTAIWRVNRVAPLLSAAAASVELSAGVRVDVDEMLALFRALMRGADLDVGSLNLIDSEIDLLSDWDDPWLLADRERLRQLRLHMIETLADRLCADGHFGLALEAAMAAVRADDLRESAHRMLIRVHIAEGNLAEARRAYEACRAVLLREVGITPSTQTTQMLSVSGVQPHAQPKSSPARTNSRSMAGNR